MDEQIFSVTVALKSWLSVQRKRQAQTVPPRLSSSMAFAAVSFLALALWSGLASALPANLETLNARAGVTTLSTAQIGSFKPYTLFARAGACPPAKTLNWSCGGMCVFRFHTCRVPTVAPSVDLANCNDLPGFVPYGAGGDGAVTQYCMCSYHRVCTIMLTIFFNRVCRLRPNDVELGSRQPSGL